MTFSGSNLDEKMEELLSEAFDKIFKVFDIATEQTILRFLEENYSLTRSEIPKNLDTFEKGLTKIFQTGNSSLIKQMLLQEVYSKIGLHLNGKEEWSLSDHLKEIQWKLQKEGVP